MITKKRKVANTKVDANKAYSLKEASALVKEVNTTKFDSSVDLHIRLGVDPKKADQAIRGTVSLPHGTGKTKKVLVLCTPDKETEAKAAQEKEMMIVNFHKIGVSIADIAAATQKTEAEVQQIIAAHKHKQ